MYCCHTRFGVSSCNPVYQLHVAIVNRAIDEAIATQAGSEAATMSEVEESARMNAQGYQESSGAKKNDEVHGAAPGSALN